MLIAILHDAETLVTARLDSADEQTVLLVSGAGRDGLQEQLLGLPIQDNMVVYIFAFLYFSSKRRVVCFSVLCLAALTAQLPEST